MILMLQFLTGRFGVLWRLLSRAACSFHVVWVVAFR